jgi:hypothetical protein
MAKVTWQGESETPNLKETTRFGVAFEKGKAVEVENEVQLRKLSTNPAFKVEDYEATEPKLVPAVTEVSVQHPVPKPGEPMPTEPAPPETEPKLSPVPRMVHRDIRAGSPSAANPVPASKK